MSFHFHSFTFSRYEQLNMSFLILLCEMLTFGKGSPDFQSSDNKVIHCDDDDDEDGNNSDDDDDDDDDDGDDDETAGCGGRGWTHCQPSNVTRLEKRGKLKQFSS